MCDSESGKDMSPSLSSDWSSDTETSQVVSVVQSETAEDMSTTERQTSTESGAGEKLQIAADVHHEL